MSPESPSSSRSPSQARRKLARTLFAAPVLTTVASGSALAATSLTCVARQVQSPVYPFVSNAPDNFLRIQLVKVTDGNNNNAVSHWVSGNALLAITSVAFEAGFASQLRVANRYQQYDIQNNRLIGTPQTVTQPPQNVTYTPNSGKFAALRFNAQGQVVGIGAGTVGSSAVTQSCLTSVAPTA